MREVIIYCGRGLRSDRKEESRGEAGKRLTISHFISWFDIRFGVDDNLFDSIDSDDPSGTIGRTTMVDQTTAKKKGLPAVSEKVLELQQETG